MGKGRSCGSGRKSAARAPLDLSGVLIVQLGLVTENLAAELSSTPATVPRDQPVDILWMSTRRIDARCRLNTHQGSPHAGYFRLKAVRDKVGQIFLR
jgi:hypothetical protein